MRWTLPGRKGALSLGWSLWFFFVLGALPLKERNLNLCWGEVPSPSRAAEAEVPLTLQGAVERALHNNPALWAKRQELGVAAGELVTANLPLQANPQLQIGVIRRSRNEGGQRVNPSISLAQEVEVAGQPGYRRKAARAGLEQAQLEIKDLERRIAGEVKVVFHRALAAQEKLKVAGQVIRLRKELLEAAQTRFAAGETAILPVKAVEVELGQAGREELELRKGLSAAQRELRRLLAWPAGELLELGGKLRYRPLGVPVGAGASLSPASRQPPSSPISLDSLLDRAFQKRPDLLARRSGERASAARLSLARAQRLPNPAFSAFYEREFSDEFIGGAISLPLPLFNRNQGEIQKARSQDLAASRETEVTRQQVIQEVSSAYDRLRLSAEQVELYEGSILPPLDENVELINVSYRMGKIGLLEVIVTQNQVVEARFGYLNALEDYLVSLSELETAVGGELSP